MKIIKPFTDLFWVCPICDTDIQSIQEHPTSDILIPDSKYWSVERVEVYCSAKCSTIRYREAQCQKK